VTGPDLFLAAGLLDPVEMRDVGMLEVAERVALDDAVWVGVVGEILERDDGQSIADQLAVRRRNVVDHRRHFQAVNLLHLR